MSFLVDTVLLSIVAVGATLFSLVHDVKMPVVAMNNAAAIIDFFMIVFFIAVIDLMNRIISRQSQCLF
jgi:hypothetical protein